MKIGFKSGLRLFVVVMLLISMMPTGVMAEETAANNDFTYEIIEGGVSINGYNGSGGDVVIPDMLGGKKVVAIGQAAFSYCRELTSIVIPDGVTSIGEEAFYNCRGLTNIKIPNSVTFIDKCAFEHCDGLTSITIPDDVTTISAYTFTQCSGLTSITIPDGVTSIEWAAFSYCSGLTSIIIPSSVTSISGLVFQGHNENLVINGFRDSYAATYAYEQSILFSANKDAEIAQVVNDLINALPVVDYLKFDDKSTVVEVRTAYDKLSDVQKAFVKNVDILIAAEAKIAELEVGEKPQEPLLTYQTHVQNVGWQGWKNNGEMSGTSGKSYRLEGIEIKVENQGYDIGVEYQTHVENIGWQGFKSNGEMSGTSGKSLRLEAIQMKLTGADADKYDIYYQVHAQNYGWLDWAKNGESAGTEGLAHRLEAIRIVVVSKGTNAPGATESPLISREAFLNNIRGDWYNKKYSVAGPYLKIREPNEEKGLLWLGSKWYENRYRIASISRDGKSGTIEAYKWNYYKPTSEGFVKTELDITPPDVYTYNYENNTITEYQYLADNVRVTTFTR